MTENINIAYIKHLPFVTKNADGLTYNWFDVHSTGDATKDYKIGSEYGVLLLKVMRNHAIDGNAELQKIVLSIANQDSKAIQHIIEGFFEMISYWMKLSVKFSGVELDSHSYDEIISNINTIKSSDSAEGYSSHLIQLLKIVHA